MEISRSAATAKGPAETFTGDVWVDPITRGLPPSQLNVAAVRFAPGARRPGIPTTAGKPCTSPKAHPAGGGTSPTPSTRASTTPESESQKCTRAAGSPASALRHAPLTSRSSTRSARSPPSTMLPSPDRTRLAPRPATLNRAHPRNPAPGAAPGKHPSRQPAARQAQRGNHRRSRGTRYRPRNLRMTSLRRCTLRRVSRLRIPPGSAFTPQ